LATSASHLIQRVRCSDAGHTVSQRFEGKPSHARFCRFIAKHFYAPVGSGVKTAAQSAEIVARLFPNDRIIEVMSYIERRMA
jgi:hypothetical protein